VNGTRLDVPAAARNDACAPPRSVRSRPPRAHSTRPRRYLCCASSATVASTFVADASLMAVCRDSLASYRVIASNAGVSRIIKLAVPTIGAFQ